MKVAIVCEWLTENGGAEKVLQAVHEMYPDAPIYTSQYRKGRTSWLQNADVRVGYLNIFPVFTRRFIAPLRQSYFKNLDLSEYDLVISVTGSDAKSIKTSGFHICYCHVPTQYYWGKREEYLKNPGFGILNPLARVFYKRFLPKLAQNDFAAAQEPDQFITISKYAQQEIKQYYKRESKVINPPVETEFFAQAVDNYKTKKGKSQTKKQYNKTTKMQESQGQKSEQKFCTNLKTVENLNVLAQIIAKYPNGFYLNFSRQVNWKRLDLAIDAFKTVNLPLVLVGDGPEHTKLKKLARGADNITFVSSLPKSDLRMLASLAKAFIFPSEEPFGIAPVEALAAGCPVIALKAGGALDFIKDGKNGIFFIHQTSESLEKALRKFETGSISLDSPKKISASVAKYSVKNFEQKIRKEINSSKKKGPVTTSRANTSPTKLNKIRRALVLSLPLILFFSNFPLINFGNTNSMHLEFSLPLLWLLLFSVLNLKTAWTYIKTHLKTPLLAFPIILILSLLISSDKSRAVLTFGVAACLLISIIGLQTYLKKHHLPKNFKKVLIIESVAICLICIIQSVFDALGVAQTLTLICKTCTSNIFGFPHPNGFAIEPQFMGSLLIAPFFLTLNSLLENKNRKSQWKLYIAAIIILSTLLLTLSRGAIFATFIATVFLIVLVKNLKKFLKIATISLISLFVALIFQGFLAVIGPTNTSFKDAISTSISQLSLGKINLEKTEKNPENVDFSEPKIETEKKPDFSGYVAESTDRRLELANFALAVSTKNPTNTVFGTGLGSSGHEMYLLFPERQGHEKEIVQNEYLELLLEVGVIGLVMLSLTIITFIKIEKFKLEPYTFSTIIAFSVAIIFFSGLPNALHIYLLPVLWYNLMYENKNCLS